MASEHGHHVAGTPDTYKHGWIPVTVPHTDVKVGDRMDRSGKTRVSKVHRPTAGTTLVQTKTGGARSPSAARLTGDVQVYRKPEYPPITSADLSTEDARRSPEVSPAEFQAHAAAGEKKMRDFARGLSGPQALSGARFKRVTDEAYDASREPWGGLTVDSHTGEHVAVDADAYALSIRKHGAETVAVSPDASREDFDNAMAEAREKFAHELSFPGAHLGVFHDADLKRIDIDPVLVTPSLEDVHDIGAFTHATGGAYHFKSGDGFWPPHIKSNKEKTMSLSFITPVLAGEFDLSSKDGKLAFWKQILPMKTVHYTAKDGTRQQIDFTREYLEGLASAQAVDSTGFLLADINNAHTMDPERWRGKVAEYEVRNDGLYGKIVFPSVEAAKAVLDNPDLGVSARIRPNIERSDGTTVPAGIIHVLGTLDPQVSGMSPWQATDLSTEQDEVLDLSEQEYEDMTEKTKGLADYTDADFEAMSEEDLDSFLAEFVPDFETYTGDETDETEEVTDETTTETTDETAKTPELVGAGADMSKQAKADIDLANQRADAAGARAAEALRRVAEAEWREERNAYLSDGVPPAALDLAAPVLNRADDMVIDLSFADEDDVNVSEVVRGLLDSLKGSIDLSTEAGHSGTHSGEGNPDQDTLDRWDASVR